MPMQEQQTAEKLSNMNNFQLLRFFDHVSNEIFRGLDTSLDDIMAAMSAEQQLMPEMVALLRLDDAMANQAMPKAEAAALVRNLLLSWAETPPFSNLLEAALANYKDNEQSADVILAVGAAISMVLLTFGQGNVQLQAFGMSINLNRGQTLEKTEALSQAFKAMPETSRKLRENASISPVIDLLKENEVLKALQVLESSVASDFKGDVIHLMARYHRWNEDQRHGVLERASATVEYQQILHETIKFAQSFKGPE